MLSLNGTLFLQLLLLLLLNWYRSLGTICNADIRFRSILPLPPFCENIFRFPFLPWCVCCSPSLSSVPLIQFSFRYRDIRCPLFRWVASHELPMWCQSIKFIKKAYNKQKKKKRTCTHTLLCLKSHILIHVLVCVRECLYEYTCIFIHLYWTGSGWLWLPMAMAADVTSDIGFWAESASPTKTLPTAKQSYEHTHIYNDSKITIEL